MAQTQKRFCQTVRELLTRSCTHTFSPLARPVQHSEQQFDGLWKKRCGDAESPLQTHSSLLWRFALQRPTVAFDSLAAVCCALPFAPLCVFSVASTFATENTSFLRFALCPETGGEIGTELETFSAKVLSFHWVDNRCCLVCRRLTRMLA